MHTMIIHFYDTRSKISICECGFSAKLHMCVHMCTIYLWMAEIWWKWQNDFKFNIIARKGAEGVYLLLLLFIMILSNSWFNLPKLECTQEICIYVRLIIFYDAIRSAHEFYEKYLHKYESLTEIWRNNLS